MHRRVTGNLQYSATATPPTSAPRRVATWNAAKKVLTTVAFVLALGVSRHVCWEAITDTRKPPTAGTKQPTTVPFDMVGLCVIAMNEERYIDEWVDYNFALGFSHIFLYDNSDNFTLRGWAKKKQQEVEKIYENHTTMIPSLTVRHWEGRGQQLEAYQDCIQRVQRGKNTMKWLAFFDVDEFLVLKQHSNVTDFLREHCGKGRVAITRYTFGTANCTNYTPEPVTKRFQYRERDIHPNGKSISLVRDINASHLPSPHYTFLNGPKPKLGHDTNGKTFLRAKNPGGPTNVAVIYHYFIRSHKEYIEKRMRGRADNGDKMTLDEAEAKFEKEGRPGEVYDDGAWQFLQKKRPDKYWTNG